MTEKYINFHTVNYLPKAVPAPQQNASTRTLDIIAQRLIAALAAILFFWSFPLTSGQMIESGYGGDGKSVDPHS